jgi:hypothetical protein
MTVDREAILREWHKNGPKHAPKTVEESLNFVITDKQALLDLISRAVDAALEDAARVVDGLMPASPTRARDGMYLHLTGEWVEQSLAAAAIRALKYPKREG